MMEWERVNVIRATQAGRARLFGVWSESQNLKAGDTFAIVEPLDSAPTAFAFVPAAGFGKVRLGQRVTLRLDAFPYHEFGLVEASGPAVSAVAVDGQYRVLLDLPTAFVVECQNGSILPEHGGRRAHRGRPASPDPAIVAGAAEFRRLANAAKQTAAVSRSYASPLPQHRTGGPFTKRANQRCYRSPSVSKQSKANPAFGVPRSMPRHEIAQPGRQPLMTMRAKRRLPRVPLSLIDLADARQTT